MILTVEFYLTRNLKKVFPLWKRILSWIPLFTILFEHGYTYQIKQWTRFARPKWLNFWKIPTHTSIGRDETKTGDYLHFEANERQEVKYNLAPDVVFTFDLDSKTAHQIFKWIVATNDGQPYAYKQIIDMMRITVHNLFLKRDPSNLWFPKYAMCHEHGWTAASLAAQQLDLQYLKSDQGLNKYNSNAYFPLRLMLCLIEAVNQGEAKCIKGEEHIKEGLRK